MGETPSSLTSTPLPELFPVPSPLLHVGLSTSSWGSAHGHVLQEACLTPTALEALLWVPRRASVL